MATFEQHVSITVISMGVLIAPLHSSGLLDINQSLIVLTLGVIGGLLPDLDSDTSKPIQIVFSIVSIILPLVMILVLFKHMSVLKMILLWGVCNVILQIVFKKVLFPLTKHRGVFHTIPMGVLLAQLIIYGFYDYLEYSLTFSTIVGIYLFIGFIIHLILDELISLNALGFKMKRSLGTALKFYDKKNILGTLFVYTSIVILFFYLPLDRGVFEELFALVKEIRLF